MVYHNHKHTEFQLSGTRLPWWLSGKESASNAGDLGSIPESGNLLEEDMAVHSNILAWRIPWTEEPDGLQSGGVTKSWT